MHFTLTANITDIERVKIFRGQLTISDGKIKSIQQLHEDPDLSLPYIIPGFIDAHVHIESSMLVPSEFAKMAVVHGTVGTVSDPHEIANVCGIEGVNFMIENGKTVPFKFHFGAPSCVPATGFETAGAVIDSHDIEKLLEREDIFYLSEMMNYPGVIHQDPEILKKIAASKKYDKPIDGHAPGVRGEDIKKYVGAGISTDHECTTKEEAIEKLLLGMKILIREGSAAKNFDALIDLLNDYPDDIMFCSDDKHPDSLLEGHINLLCKRASMRGIDTFKILKAACINPVKHYGLKVGTLHIGDAADFIIVHDLKNFKVIQTYIDGKVVAEDGVSKVTTMPCRIINNFNCTLKYPRDFQLKAQAGVKEILAIEAIDGQLITKKQNIKPLIKNNLTEPDPDNDVLKLVVVNRYTNTPVAISFVKNFGLKKSAIASSVAHDSHNIIAVGTNDELICNAVNLIIKNKGGISITSDNDGFYSDILKLPIGGLMSNEEGKIIAEKYTQIDKKAKEFGSKLSSPFMTLSFLALLVIPELKLSDKGLFDVESFCFI